MACQDEVKAPVCGQDEVLKKTLNGGNCPIYACECVPKEECPQLEADMGQLKPGEVIREKTIGCCPMNEVVCDKTTCPPIPTCAR